MSKKNIGVVTVWGERGAGYVSKQYVDSLLNSFNVYIYNRPFSKNDNSFWYTDYNVTNTTFYPLSVPTAIEKRHFLKWIREKNIEILFFNEQHWLEPVFWAKEIGIICGSYIDYYTEDTIPFFKIYDFLICNTKRHYSVFKWHPNVFYLPWGTNVELFRNNSNSLVSKDKVTFFHSAGVSPERKGTLEALRAVLSVKEASLIIHSQIDLINFSQEMKEAINELQSEERLTIINKTITAPGLYHLGDVYLYPSRLDGIGLTLIEALSCGLPVITPDVPPMNEFGDDTCSKRVKAIEYTCRADGYYWPLCRLDQQALNEAVNFFAQNNNNLTNYKIAAREYALKFLDWKSNNNTLIEIFSNAKFSKNSLDSVSNYSEVIRERGNFDLRFYDKYPYFAHFYVKLKSLIKKKK